MTPNASDDHGQIFREVKIGANELLAQGLRATFDEIAKIAMRASAELSDTQNDIGVAPKMMKAHAAVTLLIDEAMRGLNNATLNAIGFVVASTLESKENP